MKMIKKRINLFVFGFVSFFASFLCVNANEIKNIDMNIYIDQYGNASVEEIWDVYLDEGTEGYRSFDLMSESEISNFRVIDDTGKEYERLSSWDVNASFSMKSYKSGINENYSSIELCWGISNYGNRRYMLKYEISNFVTQYTDKQGIYFNLLDLDQVVGDVKIKIYSDMLFSLDNTRIWAFGNNGTIDFKDGAIVMNSGGKLSASQYMVLLVRFENDLFNLNNISSKSFDMVYDEAMEDVSLKNKIKDIFYDDGGLTSFGILGSIVLSFLFFLFNPITLIIVFLMFRVKKKKRLYLRRCPYVNLNFGIDGKKLPDDKEINYFRDIPCNKDLCYAYWICFQYNLIPLNELREGIIGAILLKWINEEKIKVVETKKKLFSFKDNNYAIDLGDEISVSNYSEYELFMMFKMSVDGDRHLEAKKFSKWCKNNYDIVELWFRNIIGYMNIMLEQGGLITNGISNNSSYTRLLCKNVNVMLKEEAIKLKGLRKFLLDFSLMPEKQYFEVHLWDEYLMFAMLLGIADKVEEQFSNLYPQFRQVSKLSNQVVFTFVKNISHTGYNNFVRSRSMNSVPDYSGTSRSSGGGGSSYFSGGSSSRGSSGGGFR